MDDLKKKGLIEKYHIQKTNGKPIDPEAKYFVLRYDDKASDQVHASLCRLALAAYAKVAKEHYPLLAKDLQEELLKYSENTAGVSGSDSQFGVLHDVSDRNAHGPTDEVHQEPVEGALALRTDDGNFFCEIANSHVAICCGHIRQCQLCSMHESQKK